MGVIRVVPIDGDDAIAITKPATGALPVGRIRLPAGIKTDVDVVGWLLDERRRGR